MTSVSSQKFPELAVYLRSRRNWYVDLAVEGTREASPPGAPPPDRGSLGQMIDGFLAILLEALDGTTHETRTFYLETLYPGLIAQGATTEQLIDSVAAWGVRVSVDFADHYHRDDRAGAIDWLARFFGAYLADISRVAHAVPTPAVP